MEDTNFDKGWQVESLHHLHHKLHPSGIKLAVGWGLYSGPRQWVRDSHIIYIKLNQGRISLYNTIDLFFKIPSQRIYIINTIDNFNSNNCTKKPR